MTSRAASLCSKATVGATIAVILVGSVAVTARAAESDAFRGYLGIRLGASILIDENIRPQMDGTRLDQVVGLSLGANLTRHLGVELAADGYELNLGVKGLPRGKTVGEYAIYTVIPQVRVRHALLDGRATAYAVGGVGIGYNEFNDKKEPLFNFDLDVGGETAAVVGAVGAGLEYFIANNIAVGGEIKYLLSRWHEIRLQGNERPVNLDTFLFTIGLRLFYP